MFDFKKRLSFMMIMMTLLISAVSPKDINALVWKMPPDVFANTGEGRSIDLAVDPFGNAFTATAVEPGILSVSRFSNALQAYEAPVQIATGGIFNISIDTDASQTALLIWLEENTNTILTAYFNGTSWITPLPTPLDIIPSGDNTMPKVAMNGLGDGLAAWDKDGVTPPGDIIVSFFNKATQTWGPLQTLNESGTGGRLPKIDYSANGTAVAIWRDDTGNLYASNFNGTSWTASPPIIGTLSLAASNYEVKMDASGNALAVWTDAANNIVSSYFNGTSWSPLTPVSLTPADALTSLAMNPSGNAIVVWKEQGTNTGFFSEFLGGIWTTPIPFALNVDVFAAAIDSSGNELIVWNDLVLNQTFSLYKPVGGFFGPIDLVTPNPDLNPTVAGLADNGRAFVDGIIPGEGRGLSGTYTLLPGQVIAAATFCNNNFASQTDRVNIIEWLPVQDVAVVAYYIYRNGVLIAVVPANGPLIFFDHNRCRNETDYYVISPVSAAGVVGPGTVVVVRN